MEFHFTFVKIVSILISASGLVAFVLIGDLILKSHRNDPDYQRGKTVKFFQALFLCMAVADFVLVLDHFFPFGDVLLTIVFSIRAILTIVTGVSYYCDIPKFKARKISIKKHNETLENIISEFSEAKLSPQIKEEFINSFKSYKE